jgi:NADPH:quinone reductase
MHLEEIDQPTPAAGEILVKIQAIGVNFIDTYKRAGVYSVPLPFTLGEEAAGTVEAIGEGVEGWAIGEKVVYCTVQGAYASYALVPVAKAIKVPASLDLSTAAAVLLQGMTAHYLAYGTYPLKPGDTCIVHAGAGGVGLLLIQMAKACGATVIATASSEEKQALARQAGATQTASYETFSQVARDITHGKGVNVVYDGVGKTTWERSLDSLCVRGSMVLYGQSSGSVPPLDPQILNQKGGLFLTRPSLWHYTQTRSELLERAQVLDWAAQGTLQVRVGATFALEKAQDAHLAIQSRNTSGKVLLIP